MDANKPLAPFPHACAKCGREYTQAEWLALHDKGSTAIPAGDDPATEPAYRLNYRDCVELGCFGTMAHPFAY
jgi:hypothetical protein